MQNHCRGAMLLPHDCNSIIRMWQLFESNTILNHYILEWFILVKLCMVMVLGNVEDEHVFSSLSFVKSKLQNCPTTHLNLIFRCMLCLSTIYNHSLSTLLFVRPNCRWAQCLALLSSCISGFISY